MESCLVALQVKTLNDKIIQALETQVYLEKTLREKNSITLQECKAKLKEKHDTIE
jgi:hypothetical protein